MTSASVPPDWMPSEITSPELKSATYIPVPSGDAAIPIGCVTTPLFGLLADRIGRKAVFIFGAVFNAAFVFPLFAMLGTGEWLLITLAMSLGYGIGFGATSSDAAPPRRRVALTPREREIVSYLRQGMRNKQIAGEMGITEGTVKIYLFRLFHKLDVRNRFELAQCGATDEMPESPSRATAAAPAGPRVSPAAGKQPATRDTARLI